MNIIISNEQSAFPIKEERLQLVVKHLLKKLDVTTHELSIYFVDEDRICQLHQQHFDDPSITDCISFPLDPPGETSDYHILGEIFVCPSVAKTYAKEHATDPEKELLLYVVHGLLHLLGYDDLEEKERAKMQEMEIKCMELIGESYNNLHQI